MRNNDKQSKRTTDTPNKETNDAIKEGKIIASDSKIKGCDSLEELKKSLR